MQGSLAVAPTCLPFRVATWKFRTRIKNQTQPTNQPKIYKIISYFSKTTPKYEEMLLKCFRCPIW